MKKVVVISVHPDDETLGCGGTLLKHLKNGDEVHCVFITDGGVGQQTIIDILCTYYRFTSVTRLGFQEQKIADLSLNDIVPVIAKTLNAIQPSILYIPYQSDAHSDHRAVFEALIACTKSFRFEFIERILMCEVISETDFNIGAVHKQFSPNYYVDISNEWEQKEKAMMIFKDELLPYPYTRNVNTMEALNRYRGSLINAAYAEAFMALKIIIR